MTNGIVYKHINDVTEDDAFDSKVVAYNTKIIAGRQVTYQADKFWKMAGDALDSNRSEQSYRRETAPAEKEESVPEYIDYILQVA